ncbi:MAG TPA: SRPBCC domain-containing protein [Nitrososphaerales archaeon]|nr:SRPBCC domain-containing protein [Nitrososphaerales archaeon]
MPESVEGTIIRTYELNASPERVYEAFTNKEDLQNWKEDHYEIDARKGGMYKMGLESDGYAVTGEFLEIVPNEKIVYSWKMSEYDEKGKLIPNWSQERPTRVTVKFEKAGNRGTKVTLIHQGFPEMDEQYYMHEAGWDLLVGQVLKAYLEKTPEEYARWWKNEEPNWQLRWQKLSEEKMKSKLVKTTAL